MWVLGAVALAAFAWAVKGMLDAAWRQRADKASLYEEMINCAAGCLPEAGNEESRTQARALFSRAFFSLSLVGSPRVVRACRRFLEAQGASSAAPQLAQDTRTRLAEMMHAMRKDLSLFNNIAPPSTSGLKLADFTLPSMRTHAPKAPGAQHAAHAEAPPRATPFPQLLRADRVDNFVRERRTG